MGEYDGEEVFMVSREEYVDIREKILSIVEESDSPINPSDLLTRLHEEGVSRELGSAIIWEMIRAGYINRSKDWRVSRGTHPTQDVRMPV